jgi:hypothetical protein
MRERWGAREIGCERDRVRERWDECERDGMGGRMCVREAVNGRDGASG